LTPRICFASWELIANIKPPPQATKKINNNNLKHAKIFSSHLAIREGIECTMCSSGSISIVACTYTTKHLKGEIVNLTHSLHKVHALENLHIEVGSRIMMCFYIDIYLWCKYQGKSILYLVWIFIFYYLINPHGW